VLKEWEASFNSLLRSPEGVELFESFLVSEFSEENIQFWKTCERFKALPDHLVGKEAEIVYAEFVAPQAPKLVSRSGERGGEWREEEEGEEEEGEEEEEGGGEEEEEEEEEGKRMEGTFSKTQLVSSATFLASHELEPSPPEPSIFTAQPASSKPQLIE
jgi:hypothetical protein